jgi:amidase
MRGSDETRRALRHRRDAKTGEGLDAAALAQLVRRGDVHPRELVEAAIERIEALDPVLNAVIHRQFDRARRDAAGPLPAGPFRGVPFLLKDYSGAEAGEPQHHGMRALRDAGWRAVADSGVATRFRAAGLIPLGRTNTPELAVMGTTEPDAYGPTRNPWALDRSPGGSSGGSGAAVAAGMVPAAHANDIAGSIRIPAANCGLVGLKPSAGRTGPAGPTGMFTEGVVTRSMRDTAALLDAISTGPSALAAEVGRDPPACRIGVCVRAFSGVDVDDGCTAAARSTGALLEALGHHIDEDAPAALFDPDLLAAARLLLGANAAAEVEHWSGVLGRTLGEDDVEPATWVIVAAGRAVTGADVVRALARQQEVSQQVAAWWADHDLLLTPTTAEPPPPLGAYKQGFAPGRASAFTRVFNFTGQPALSLPLGWPADGLPRGVQLVAAPGHEDLLVRVGAQLEAAAPWSDRRPVVDASRS